MAKKKGNVLSKMYKKHAGAKRENLKAGKYVATAKKLSLTLEGDKPNGNLTFIVQRGKYQGKPVNRYYQFFDRKTKNGTLLEGEKDFVRFMEDMAAIGIDTEEVPLEELEEAVADESPLVQITVKENNGFTNVFINELLESDDDEEDDEDEAEESDDDDEDDSEGDDDAEDDEDEESEEEDSDDEEESEEDDEEEYEPKKGESVLAQPKGTKKFSLYTVKTVNKTKQTCSLTRDSDSKEFKNVPWDKIEQDDDE